MLENIRQIGIFMIIAQTVMHFAAGRQYEKYMKIISGVIVLLLFIRPFVSDSDHIAARWQEEAARMMEQIEERNEAGYQMSYVTDSTQAAVIQQIEEEIRSRLNDRIADRDEQVVAVAIDLKRSGGGAGAAEAGETSEPVFERVRITVQKSCDMKQSPGTVEEGMIRIDEIIVETEAQREEGDGAAGEQDVSALRRLFAQTLGIAEDRVEVLYLGE